MLGHEAMSKGPKKEWKYDLTNADLEFERLATIIGGVKLLAEKFSKVSPRVICNSSVRGKLDFEDFYPLVSVPL
jgi:hypothetical protein